MRYVPLFALAAAALAMPASAAVETGAAARDFQIRDARGQVVTLSQFRGQTVVIEWNNPGCPYVKKHYDSGNMQRTQTLARQQGAIWLTINSGAPGKQGYMQGPEAVAFVAAQQAKPNTYLLDPTGVVGKAYGATATPHLYVIAPDGKLAYQGAIDDKPTSDAADIKTARNHVLAALGEMKAGKPVSVAQTKAYGCSVKYAD